MDRTLSRAFERLSLSRSFTLKVRTLKSAVPQYEASVASKGCPTAVGVSFEPIQAIRLALHEALRIAPAERPPLELPIEPPLSECLDF